jgi:MSHA biogenesis protein MshJ
VRQALHRLAERIDAFTLRERVLLFAAVLAILIILPYAFIVQPALRRQQQLLDTMRKEQSQIQAMQEQLRVLAASDEASPSQALVGQLTLLERRVADVEREIEQKQKQLVPSGRLSDVVRHMIAKSARLEIVSLTSMKGQPVEVSPAPAATPGAKAKPAAGPENQAPQLYKHGVEIVLRGTFLDLLAYVAEVETAHSRLMWGPLALTVEKYPMVTLSASVFTFSSDPSVLTF